MAKQRYTQCQSSDPRNSNDRTGARVEHGEDGATKCVADEQKQPSDAEAPLVSSTSETQHKVRARQDLGISSGTYWLMDERSLLGGPRLLNEYFTSEACRADESNAADEEGPDMPPLETFESYT